ncbi:MAG: SoxR reducing system RseC family protein [Pelosinus sp.]|nr:SoxR reducing system RseC family protein [Pelosinus sp.]
MDKQQEGIVLSIDGGLAKVKTSRHNDCENCGACPGNSALVLEARNTLGAKPGDRVLIEVQEVNMLKAAFIVYMLPLLAIFIGAVFGNFVAEKMGYGVTLFQVAGGFILFLLSVLYIKLFDLNARNDVKMQPVIAKIL